jgi:hypothetical protein
MQTGWDTFWEEPFKLRRRKIFVFLILKIGSTRHFLEYYQDRLAKRLPDKYSTPRAPNQFVESS